MEALKPDTMKLWNTIKRPPTDVLKPIRAGRLKGKSDISPQWRYKAMTEYFGPCGIGWKYEIKNVWNETGSEGQVFAFAEVLVYTYIKEADKWSAGVPGIGGSMLVAKESKGLYSSDEGYKMAVTDALSVAMKMLGMAADIYEGLWDGSKYTKNDPEPSITDEQSKHLVELAAEVGADYGKFCKFFKVEDTDKLPASQYKKAIAMLEKKREANEDN